MEKSFPTFEQSQTRSEEEKITADVNLFTAKWGQEYIKDDRIAFLPEEYVASTLAPWNSYLSGKQQTKIATPFERYNEQGLGPETITPQLGEQMKSIEDKVAHLNAILDQLYRKTEPDVELEQQMLEAYEDLYRYYFETTQPLLVGRESKRLEESYKQYGRKVPKEKQEKDAKETVEVEMENLIGKIHVYYMEKDEQRRGISGEDE